MLILITFKENPYLNRMQKKRLIPYAKTEQNKQTLQHKTYV